MMNRFSPFTQYTLRKLLAQYIQEVDYPIYQCLSSGCFGQLNIGQLNIGQLNIRQVVEGLYVNRSISQSKLQELESLLLVYQNAEQGLLDLESQEIIRHKIYRLLGLQLLSVLSGQMPRMLQEDQASIFQFYHAQEMRFGLRHAQQLYGQVYQVQSDRRLQIFKLFWILIQKEVSALLTIGETQYTIWVDLRSPDYKSLYSQGLELLNTLDRFHRYHQKFKRPRSHPSSAGFNRYPTP
jgi:hypothetical protein